MNKQLVTIMLVHGENNKYLIDYDLINFNKFDWKQLVLKLL